MTSEVMRNLFIKMKIESEEARIQEYTDLQTVFDGDYLSIVKLVKEEFKNKPFQEASLNAMAYLYRNEVNKAISRKTAGIFDNRPIRELILKESKKDTNIITVLEHLEYDIKILDMYEKSKFFNTIILYYTFRNNKTCIDVLTPSMCTVETNDDIYEIKAIKISRVDGNGDLYNVYWDDDIIMAEYDDGTPKKLHGIKNDVNPYKKIANELGIRPMPFSVYRNKKGINFWGEPNWTLYTHQLHTIMSLTDNVYGEFMQKFPPLVTIDAKDVPGILTLSPGKTIDLKSEPASNKSATMSYLESKTDWFNLRENETNRRKNMYNSEGIPESSASVTGESPKQIGSKTIDELELEESKGKDRRNLYFFELNTLPTMRMVNNYHNGNNERLKLNNKGYFSITYSEERIHEDVDTKIKRRNMEVSYHLKDEIDFAMEDLELDRTEAIEYLNERLGLDKSSDEKTLREKLKELRSTQSTNNAQQPQNKNILSIANNATR